MTIVDTEDLEVAYGAHVALGGVSLRVPAGSIGLLGPNGAGKSTLMKTLLGFIRPTRGTVKVLGMDMPEQALSVRQNLGYMPEKDLLSPKVSAVSFLVYCGCLHGMTRPDAMERAHAVLNYVGLGESRYRKMETYSKGMCQRVKFGQAIIHDPKLLLLDEPTNGLDPDGRIEMLELIGDLTKKRNISTIISTHLLPDVQAICDHVVIINRGKVVLEGTIDTLTSIRQGLLEIRVNENQQEFTAAVERLRCGVEIQEDGTLLVIKPDDVKIPALFGAAKECGTHIRHLKPVRQSLEETFMGALGHGGVSASPMPPPLPASDAKSADASAGIA